MEYASELMLFFGCLVLSGFYSGAEAALVSISIDRAQQLVDKGGRGVKALEFLIKKPNIVLTTLLVGNNIVNILAASVITVITARHFQEDAIAIATGVTTFLILIFGEIIPKTFARKHNEKLAIFILRVLQVNYYLLYPLIKVLTFVIESLLGKNAQLERKLVTKTDLEYMIQRAEEHKTMDSKQIDMLASIMEFPHIKVKDIMVPRKDVKTIDSEMNFRDVIHSIRDYGHSRYPVVGEDLEDTIGFLHVKDLAFVKANEVKKFKVTDLLKPPFFVYEHMKIQAVFDYMKRKKVHLALVKNENGLVVGIITLEDIIEEIFGEIQDEHDNEEEEILEVQNADLESGIILDSDYSLRDLDNDFEIKIPLNDNYSTLAGFILDLLANEFPETGQIIVWEDYSFSLDEVHESEIVKVKIKRRDGSSLYSKSESTSAEEESTGNP